MADQDADDFLAAVRPLVERVGARLVTGSELGEGDVPLSWGGTVVAGVRLPESSVPPAGIGDIIADVEGEIGSALATLDRSGKQRAVRLLEERGAFTYRKAAETVAQALDVSRFTVYNYLNREHETSTNC